MASLRARVGVDGLTYYQMVWRDPKTRRQHVKSLGAIHLSQAQALARDKTQSTARRAPPREAVGALIALSKFKAYWTGVKRRTADTVEYYDRLLRPCFEALGARGPMRSWSERWLGDYVATKTAEWSPRTVQMLLIACRTFTKWARRQGYDVPDFARDIEGPKVEKAQRAAYSADELRLLLETAAAEWHRLRPAIALAALAGLSLGDLRKITWASIDLKGGWITTTRSKTGRPVLVPIGKTLRAALQAVGPLGPDVPVCTLPASDSSLYKAWARLCRRADVPSKGGFKRLRHTYATLLDASQVVDSATRRDLMAHAPGSKETDGYTHSDRDRLKAGIEALEAALRSAKRQR